jgi:hypothetical protein
MLKSAVMSAVNGLKVGISSVNEGDAKLLIYSILTICGEEKKSILY